jgi:hypothetical protein
MSEPLIYTDLNDFTDVKWLAVNNGMDVTLTYQIRIEKFTI